MKVKREAVVAAVTALVLTVVLIGAVGAKVVSPLATEQGMITNLHMSNSCEGPGTILFDAGTETVYLVFDYSDMHGEEMRIAVTGPWFNTEAEHSSVIKSSGWVTETWSEAHEEQYVKACGTVSPNATLTSTFKADKVSMSYVKDTDGGFAEVQVDSATPITVDMYAGTTTKGEMVIASGLGAELHTITVKATTQTGSGGGSCVGVDRFWNNVVLHDETHSYTDSGPECIPLTYSGDAIPAGNYIANIYSGGLLPIKSKLWHVRPGGPGEITNLHMSISSDGPPMEEFIAGTRTVWAVFDYSDMDGNEVGIDVYEGDSSFYESPRVPLTGSGTKAISVTHQYLTGFPAGPYRTHVMKDGFVDGVENWSITPGPPADITVTADPTSIQVGGFTSTIQANVTDAYGNAVVDGTTVSFSPDLGFVDPVTTTTTSGVAVTTLTSGSTAGTATVTAQSGAAEGTTSVTFVSYIYLPLVLKNQS